MSREPRTRRLQLRAAAAALGIPPRRLIFYWDLGVISYKKHGRRYRYIVNLNKAKRELAMVERWGRRKGLAALAEHRRRKSK